MYQTVPNISVDEPVLCEGSSGWETGGYIRVHGHGTRKLVLGRKAFERACPGVGLASGQCEVAILADTLARAVVEKLQRENGFGEMRFGGIGLGVCGEIDEALSYDAFRPSVSVFDWRDVAPAAAATAETMATWDVGGHFGVSVRGIPCGYLTEARTRDLAHTPVFGDDFRFETSSE